MVYDKLERMALYQRFKIAVDIIDLSFNGKTQAFEACFLGSNPSGSASRKCDFDSHKQFDGVISPSGNSSALSPYSHEHWGSYQRLKYVFAFV